MVKHTLKILRCGVNTARLLEYVGPFFNIVKERVNGNIDTNELKQKNGTQICKMRVFSLPASICL